MTIAASGYSAELICASGEYCLGGSYEGDVATLSPSGNTSAECWRDARSEGWKLSLCLNMAMCGECKKAGRVFETYIT